MLLQTLFDRTNVQVSIFLFINGELHQTVGSELGGVLGEGGWGQDHAQGPAGPGQHQPH